MIPISKPFLGEEEVEAVAEVLRSGVLAQSSRVREFEREFARFIGVKYAIAVSSGTAALHVALISVGVRPGDRVITTPLTFFATTSSILLCGGVPVYVDVDEKTMNMSPRILRRTRSEAKVILPVHLHGHPVDMDPILKISKEAGFIVLEDAAQAHGAEYKGRKVGSLGDAAIFSFYPTKNMTTIEGGVIVTNDDEIAERARVIRDQGQTKKYLHEYLGFNYRMTEVSAAVGLVQLKKLDRMNRRRENIARTYMEELDLDEVELPYVAPWAKHAWHLFPLRTSAGKRDLLVEKLNSMGVMARPIYPMPVHRQPIMTRLSDPEKNFLYSLFPKDLRFDETPVAERLTREVFYIPIHPAMSDDDVNTVVRAVKGAVREVRN